MTIEVTERWDGDRLTIDQDGWRAQRRFDVTGTNKPRRAVQASGVPVRGASHPENTRLVVRSKRVVQRRGPQHFVVGVSYRIPDFGQQERGEDEDGDPLNQPAEIDVQFASEREEFDRTPGGFAIQNSALRPFDQNPTRDAGPIELTITRNEPFYDVQKAVRFRNLINTDFVYLDGKPLFGQLVGRVLNIEPARSFSFGDPFVKVRYRFLLRERVIVNGAAVSAHHLRLMDRGYHTRTLSSVSGGAPVPVVLPIRDDEGEAFDEPQPLNGIGGELGTNAGIGPPRGVVATERTQDAVWLWYRRYPEGSYRRLF